MKRHPVFKDCSRCSGRGVIILNAVSLNDLQAQGVVVEPNEREMGCAKCKGEGRIKTDMWVEVGEVCK